MRARLCCVVLSSAVGCSGETLPVEAASFVDADALFHQEPRWIGGDGAFSIPLDDERTLWLFGDTFIATSEALTREESRMVRNTVAIQTGRDPSSATFEAFFAEAEDGTPASFFAEDGDRWFWPNHGALLPSGPLVLFLGRQRASDDDLGFAGDGYVIVLVDNWQDPPDQWQLRSFDGAGPAADPHAAVGVAVIATDDHLLAYTSAAGNAHRGWLARFDHQDLMDGRAEPAWLSGGAFIPAAELGQATPDAVIDDIGPEFSVHFDGRWGRYVHVASVGFGATTIAMRTATEPTGPFSDPIDVFTPPESDSEEEPFVYAAKAHPHLSGPSSDDLLVTYATNSFDFDELVRRDDLYFPRFVRVTLGEWD